MATPEQIEDWQDRAAFMLPENVARLEAAIAAVYGFDFLEKLQAKHQGTTYVVALIRLTDRLAGRKEW